MWDLKLIVLDIIFYVNFYIYEFFFQMLNIIDPLFFNGLLLINFKLIFQFIQNVTIFFSIKFLLAISFLILIRGGTPRYRYDYLTKLGWLRFIGLVILIFFFSLIIFFIF